MDEIEIPVYFESYGEYSNTTLMHPLVSVIVLTYNQKETITETINSILNQKCDFPFEIIIGDDNSVDGTVEILEYFRNSCPNKIRLILNKTNLGILRNYKNLVLNCAGTYVAQCAGDDFWNREDKLQTQVAFMQSDNTIGLIHTDADFFYENIGEIIKNFNKANNISIPNGDTFEHLLYNNFIIAPTVMYLKKAFEKSDFDNFIKSNFIMEDYPLWLEISKHYKIIYLSDSFATYRIHNKSTSSINKNNKSLNFHNSVYFIKNYFIDKYGCSTNLRKKIDQKFYSGVIEFYFSMRNYSMAYNAALKLKAISNNRIGLMLHLYVFGSHNLFLYCMIKGIQRIQRKFNR